MAARVQGILPVAGEPRPAMAEALTHVVVPPVVEHLAPACDDGAADARHVAIALRRCPSGKGSALWLSRSARPCAAADDGFGRAEPRPKPLEGFLQGVLRGAQRQGGDAE
jgi:hypothetical protein